jgi:hypothetical protein
VLGGQRQAPAALPLRKRPATNCTESWMGLGFFKVHNYVYEKYIDLSIKQFLILFVVVCFRGSSAQSRAMSSTLTRFLDPTQRRATVGRTPLDE